MESELISVRIKAFGYELLGLLITGVLAFLASADFQALVASHFGETLTASLILLVVSGGVKHLRNLLVIKQFGGEGERPTLL